MLMKFFKKKLEKTKQSNFNKITNTPINFYLYNCIESLNHQIQYNLTAHRNDNNHTFKIHVYKNTSLNFWHYSVYLKYIRQLCKTPHTLICNSFLTSFYNKDNNATYKGYKGLRDIKLKNNWKILKRYINLSVNGKIYKNRFKFFKKFHYKNIITPNTQKRRKLIKQTQLIYNYTAKQHFKWNNNNFKKYIYNLHIKNCVLYARFILLNSLLKLQQGLKLKNILKTIITNSSGVKTKYKLYRKNNPTNFARIYVFKKKLEITTDSFVKITNKDGINFFWYNHMITKKKKLILMRITYSQIIKDVNVQKILNLQKAAHTGEFTTKMRLDKKGLNTYKYKLFSLYFNNHSHCTPHTYNDIYARSPVYLNSTPQMCMHNFHPTKTNKYIINNLSSFFKKKKTSLISISNEIGLTNYYPLFCFLLKKARSNSHIINIKTKNYYFTISHLASNKYKYFYITFLINFLEDYLSKKVWVRVTTKKPYPMVWQNYIGVYLFKYTSHLKKFYKLISIKELLEILWITFKNHDLQILLLFLKKRFENSHFKKHKKILLIFFEVLKKNKELLKFMGVKGFLFDIRGKVGVSGNAKKRHTAFSIGKITTTSQNLGSYMQQINIWTPTGQMGMTCVLQY